MPARHQAAAIHHFALPGGDGEKIEIGMVPPKTEKPFKVIGHVTCPEQSQRGMARVRIFQNRDRRNQTGRKIARRLIPARSLGHAQDGGPDLFPFQIGENPLGGFGVAHFDRFRRGPEQRLQGASEFGLHFQALQNRYRLPPGQG